MNTRSPLISAAVLALLAAGVTGTAAAADNAAKEKCYGIAAAGANDCAANGHACKGQAKTDNDPAEWKYVDKGSCATMGGRIADAKPAA
jgi:uncharacterized membrane protein